jgi:purine-nucleoside phosphorylase
MAGRLGLEVAGFSVITNLAAGISKHPLNHKEVIESSAKISAEMVRLVTELIKMCNNH